jgi:hypothetical protein
MILGSSTIMIITRNLKFVEKLFKRNPGFKGIAGSSYNNFYFIIADQQSQL